MSWERATTLSDLDCSPVVFKKSPKQIAVFKVGENIYAVDNRCPHEGYPLAEGHVDDDCMLTCNWHNWKFRLQDGECVLGGDDVRTYPVKQKDGNVWVDIADPPPEEVQARVLQGLRRAFDERDFGRICREITRLHHYGLDPQVALTAAIGWSHDRFEYGTTHAYAACADWLAKYGAYDGDWEKQLICLAETVDHMAFDALRQPPFPFAKSGEAFEESAFTDAVEREDFETAESIVARGFDDGLQWSDMESAFASAALAHFNSFGHSLIYVYKASQVLDLADNEIARYLILPLARHLCYATREDLIPEFKTYGESIGRMDSFGDDQSPKPDPRELFPMSTRQAHLWIVDSASSQRPMTLYWPLLEALARSMLHYDTSYDAAFDRPVSQNIGWLNFSHGLTFANAVRVVCSKYPELWPQGLLQMGCMLGRNRRFLDLELDESPWFGNSSSPTSTTRYSITACAIPSSRRT